MRRNAEGKRVPLTGPKYDAIKDTYSKKAPRTSYSLRFFADIDDLEEVEAIAVRMYERDVMPYEVEVTTSVTTAGNKTVTKVDEKEPVSDPEVENTEEETDENM
jgi:hypothetical protein